MGLIPRKPPVKPELRSGFDMQPEQKPPVKKPRAILTPKERNYFLISGKLVEKIKPIRSTKTISEKILLAKTAAIQKLRNAQVGETISVDGFKFRRTKSGVVFVP